MSLRDWRPYGQRCERQESHAGGVGENINTAKIVCERARRFVLCSLFCY